MKLPSPLVLLAVLVTLFVAACSHPPAFLAATGHSAPRSATPATPADHAFTLLDAETAAYAVDGAVGDILTLTLDDHPTTGFAWEVASLPPQVALLGQERLARAAEPGGVPTRVGEPGKVRYRFAAERPGQGVLVLAFRRPWETDKAPARFVVAHVTVR